MENLIEKLAQSNLTWSVAIVIIAIVMRPVLLAALEIASENIKSRREMERDRLDTEREQTKMLGLLKDELVNSRGINTQLIANVNAIPDALRSLQTQMTDRVGQADRKREAIHTDVKTIPAEIMRLSEPKFDALRTDFERIIDGLRVKLESRIDPQAENARQVIREEFAAMTARLSDIETTINRFAPDTMRESSEPITKKSHEEKSNDGTE